MTTSSRLSRHEQKRLELLDAVAIELGTYLREVHCSGCGRFIGYYTEFTGLVAMLCPGCSAWVVLDNRNGGE